MVLRSYAKLNLFLLVLELRKDNYHNIKTLFERIDLSDKIILKSRQDKKIKILCSSPDVPCDSSNLVFRSAKLLQDKFKIKEGVDIKIIKRIPVGAGLAGGSSNAACVLQGLSRLWKLNLTQNELVGYAQDIGSDVAFFIYNCRFAEGSSRGDKIKPLKTLNKLRLWHILVVPKIKVSTPMIYKKWDELNPKKARLTPPFWQGRQSKYNLSKRAGLTSPEYGVKILILALRKKDRTLISKSLFNSLETVTGRLYPRLRRIRERLSQLGLNSILMSGSGPAVFGIISSRKEACLLARQLKQDCKSWQLFVTKTV